MKRIIMSLLIAAVSIPALAQSTEQEYLERYNRLTKNVGNAGVGVETLINRWEEAFPEDENMLAAAFLFYYEKCQSDNTVSMGTSTYLGQKPILQLKDSLGNDVYYYYDTQYDDELFGKAQQYIDKVNQKAPLKLENRCAAITALANYEKGSPDMALSRIKELVAFNYGSKPAWTYEDQAVDNEMFKALVQEYCYSFFKLATPSGYEAFRSISEDMLKYNADDVLFLDNLGSYHLVGKNDPKAAQKFYDKVLKIKKDDLTAIRNGVILSRKMKNVKLEKKYLALLAQYAEDEPTKQSSQARLDYLNGKK
ncbi:MAG: hypothetical protein MJY88_00705 [Bacteroidales bacterium]|nr:hypothetical protein [Bacteroidales bacterium]